MVLSHFQTGAMLSAFSEGKQSVVSSTDLGMTPADIRLFEQGVALDGKTVLSWDAVRQINDSETTCFAVENNAARPVKGYSERSGWSFSLLPTETAPALIVAGFPMHRVKNISPLAAAKLMIDTLSPVRGKVLDTATGLGYTAIMTARTADQVITVEREPVAQEIARQNPWSGELFNNQKIEQIIGNCMDIILELDSSVFSCIVHDPPASSLAGDLYSQEFYLQLFRVIKSGGKLFHYIGDPQTKSGERITGGVIRRLHDAGFRQVLRKPLAFGVVAIK
jgi:predicted methyltransferase